VHSQKFDFTVVTFPLSSGASRVLKVDAAGYVEHSSKTVTLNGLAPAQSYLVSVETLTAAGTKSSRNSSLIMTTASHRNDLNIVIVLVVIIGILLAVIVVGLIHSAVR
jgi:subtilase family serine protease